MKAVNFWRRTLGSQMRACRVLSLSAERHVYVDTAPERDIGMVGVALSDGMKFLSVSSWMTDYSYAQGWRTDLHPRVVGDMNGDGKDDLIGFGQDGVYVALSNGASFDSVSRWTNDFDLSHGWTVGDVNADGKADLIGFGFDGVYIGTAK